MSDPTSTRGGIFSYIYTNARTFHVAIDAIKAINIMKNGGAMDGAFSHSPQAVRDSGKAEIAGAEQRAGQTSEGLWSGPPPSA